MKIIAKGAGGEKISKGTMNKGYSWNKTWTNLKPFRIY